MVASSAPSGGPQPVHVNSSSAESIDDRAFDVLRARGVPVEVRQRDGMYNVDWGLPRDRSYDAYAKSAYARDFKRFVAERYNIPESHLEDSGGQAGANGIGRRRAIFVHQRIAIHYLNWSLYVHATDLGAAAGSAAPREDEFVYLVTFPGSPRLRIS